MIAQYSDGLGEDLANMVLHPFADKNQLVFDNLGAQTRYVIELHKNWLVLVINYVFYFHSQNIVGATIKENFPFCLEVSHIMPSFHILVK